MYKQYKINFMKQITNNKATINFNTSYDNETNDEV